MAKKKRRKPYDGDPMMVTKLSRWGTKAQGEANARERAYKNRIHELETALANQVKYTEFATRQRDDIQSRLNLAAPPGLLIALRAVCSIPTHEAVSLGISKDLIVLCLWVMEIDGSILGRGPVSSGKETA